MRETIALEADIDKSCVLVQGFEHNGFYLLAEEIVGKFNLANFLVLLKSIDKENKTCIIQTAWAEVKFLELGATMAITHDDSGKDL